MGIIFLNHHTLRSPNTATFKMKFPAILHTALLITTALAFPTANLSPNPPDTTIRRSRLSSRLQTLLPTDSSAAPPTVTYNQNWAGAVLVGAGYRTVAATVTVPPVRLPPGSNSDVLHAVSAWVGIDGERACPNAILQAGVDMYMNHSIPHYWAWYDGHHSLTSPFPSLPFLPCFFPSLLTTTNEPSE